MIKVVAKQTIKEDMIESCKKVISGLVEETRKEEGCISYELYQDIKKKNILTFIEEWESTDALKRHMNTKHFLEATPKISAMQEKEEEINVYSVVF